MTTTLSLELPAGIALLAAPPQGAEQVLGPEALAFAAAVVRRFRPEIADLMASRRMRQAFYDRGGLPDFREDTAAIRSASWTVNPLPACLADRRVEITGPADRKMTINALNSGASVFMADLEDSTAPSWSNCIHGQQNIHDAVRQTITYDAPDTGKSYRLAEKTALLFVRPRGLHLVERHFLVDGTPATAALFDVALFLYHNARELVARGFGPWLYLPKLESHEEARLWRDVFVACESELGLPRGTIKATVLIETLPAAFEMDEILWVLREHSAGLNCGRWDFIFSTIKKLAAHEDRIFPDRAQVGMDRAFLRAYSRLLIHTCHRRKAHAMGGMAAQIPIKHDAAANEQAMSKVRADKLREVQDGHDGTWVAHPGLVPIARAIFDENMPGANQIDRATELPLGLNPPIGKDDLLQIHDGTRTEEGLRHNVRVGILYIESWLRGHGCVPIYDLMEDAATAEICRAQVWQWIRHGAALEDGSVVRRERVEQVIDEECAQVRAEVGEDRFTSGRFKDARELFRRLATAERFEEFLTVPAYEMLEG